MELIALTGWEIPPPPNVFNNKFTSCNNKVNDLQKNKLQILGLGGVVLFLIFCYLNVNSSDSSKNSQFKVNTIAGRRYLQCHFCTKIQFPDQISYLDYLDTAGLLPGVTGSHWLLAYSGPEPLRDSGPFFIQQKQKRM